MGLYKIIKDKCTEKGITITQLEEVCELSQNSIKKWEKNSPKSIESLIKIACYFDVTTDYLLGLSDNPSPCKCCTDTEEAKK